jgi:RHS repeat-associated protein
MPYTVTKNAWSGSPAFTANRTYEGTREALRSIENRVDGSLVSGYTYQVNQIDQRVSVQTAGSAFGVAPNFDPADWAWDYNARGELVAADSPTTARDRAFEYDSIGNRKKFAHGTLNLPASDNFQANALNQYQAVPDFAPQPGFDPDGNMTSGPVPGTAGNTAGVQPPANATNLQWDAENRLISTTVLNGTTTSVITYQYDYLSRLILRQLNQNTPTHYHYDGWNRVAEYSGTSLSRTYTWGLDLSGTIQGAGGVGGLLATRHGSTSYFTFYDGNGNVTEYMTQSGSQEAHYEYDPFGNLTRRTGTISSLLFAYRFSTKPRDANTGLYYYGYRYYDPVTGRWPSRDPIEEEGGINLYGFVANNGVGKIDVLGMLEVNVVYNGKSIGKLKSSDLDYYHANAINGRLAKESSDANGVFIAIDFQYNEGVTGKDCGCQDIKFIQFIKTNDPRKTAAEDGFAVDSLKTKDPYYNLTYSKGQQIPDYLPGGGKVVPSTLRMIDTPYRFDDAAKNIKSDLEWMAYTFVVCIKERDGRHENSRNWSSGDVGIVLLEGIKWGYTRSYDKKTESWKGVKRIKPELIYDHSDITLKNMNNAVNIHAQSLVRSKIVNTSLSVRQIPFYID